MSGVFLSFLHKMYHYESDLLLLKRSTLDGSSVLHTRGVFSIAVDLISLKLVTELKYKWPVVE